MNKKRNQYVYHLVGVINQASKYQISEGKYQGTNSWKLAVDLESKPEIKTIKVFANSLENQSIWEALASKDYFGKRYVLHCRNWKGNYYLINWEELEQFPSKEEDYGSN